MLNDRQRRAVPRQLACTLRPATLLLLYVHSHPAQSLSPACNDVGGLIHGNTTPVVKYTLSPCSVCLAMVSEGSCIATLLLPYAVHSHIAQSVMQCCQRAHTWQHYSCRTLSPCVRGLVNGDITHAIRCTISLF